MEATLQEFHQWLIPGLEKVIWCGDLSGDRFSAEAKLNAVNELKESLRFGADKRSLSSNKFKEVEDFLDDEKREEMEEFMLSNEDDWIALNNQILQAAYVMPL